MKKYFIILFLGLCSSSFAGPNPGVPTDSSAASRKEHLFLYQLATPAFIELGDTSFPIVEAWIEYGSTPEFPWGRKRTSGYVLVCRLDRDKQKWPFQKFTLWSDHALYGSGCGLSIGSDTILVHPYFDALYDEYTIRIRRESDRATIQIITLKKKTP